MVRGAVAGSEEEVLFNVFAEIVLLRLVIAVSGVMIIYLLMVNSEQGAMTETVVMNVKRVARIPTDHTGVKAYILMLLVIAKGIDVKELVMYVVTMEFAKKTAVLVGLVTQHLLLAIVAILK